ncbi:MAG: efflux RND transporter periplasmic adaptor subunit [Planctomycetes bacterium]|nr:efflux RND transporter periplasmic adaptor subunit [Planctomycetota bacterium]
MKRKVGADAFALDLANVGEARRFRTTARRCASIVLVMALAGCSDNTSDTPPVGAIDRAVSVHVAEAKITTLRPKLNLVGTIIAIPERTAVVSPQLGGWVAKLDVVEGQSVHDGDVLVELDTRSADVSAQRARAIVAEKDAVVKRLKSGYLPEEIAGARQEAHKAAATVDGLRNELAALKNLLDRGEISPVTYETKAETLASAEAALAAAQEQVKLLEAGTRPESIAEAEALLAAANADLAQAELAVELCTITSPIDGVVVQLPARKGQYFDRAVPLATIIDLSAVFAQFRIPSRDFSRVSAGTPVDIQLDALPGRTFPGSVARRSAQADPLTGNVIVYALVENDDHVLQPGLSCSLQVSLPEVADALAVPVAAVADHSGSPVVTVVREGKAYETQVKTGIETQDFVQILNGLSAGDLVATAGGYGLPEGCPVKVVADR